MVPIVLRRRMRGELESKARYQRASICRADSALVCNVDLLLANVDRVLPCRKDLCELARLFAAARIDAVEQFRILTRIAVDLVFAISVDVEAAHLLGLERIRRQLELMISHTILTRAYLIRYLERIYRTFPFILVHRNIHNVRDLGLRRTRCDRRIRICDNQRVARTRMFKEIEDALFFHQARREIPIRFAILNAIISWFVVSLKPEARVKTIEHFSEHVRYGKILENAVVRTLRKQPNLRADDRAVFRKA